MNIVFVANNDYIQHLSVAIISLLNSNQDMDIKIYIFDAGISMENQAIIFDLCIGYRCEVCFIDMKPLERKLEQLELNKWRNSYSAYYKLFAVDVLTECDKILILDADMAVVSSLKALYETNNEKAIYMAQDMMFADYNRYLGNKLADAYYNAGTILLNAEQWKEQNFSRKISLFLEEKKQVLIFPEQDVLCTLFQDKIAKLNPEYNFMFKYVKYSDLICKKIWGYKKDSFYTKKAIDYAKKNPVIYHFEEKLSGRPWDEDNTHPFEQIYDQYLNMTPFAGQKKKVVKRSITFKIQQRILPCFPGKCGCWLQVLAMKLDYIMRIRKAKRGN